MSYSARYQRAATAAEKILTVVGLVLCVLFLLMLICNLTIIIKGAMHPETPPSVLGIMPLIVLSGSMSGDAEDHIESGDLIIVGKADTARLRKGDIIAFQQDGVVVTHRIIDIDVDASGSRLFTTKGDANNASDEKPVSQEQVLGIYKLRLPKVGDFAMFLQTPWGLILFCGVPVLGFVIYDLIRRQLDAVRRERERNARLQERMKRLGISGEGTYRGQKKY